MIAYSRHQNNKQNRSVWFALFILAAVIILIFTVGINLLLNSAHFIARLGQKESEPVNRNDRLIADIDIDSLPVATNSSRIIIGGSVINFELVEFYLNGDLVKETPLLVSDSFSEEIGDLNGGENEVFVIGKTKDATDEKKSKVYTVIYKSDKPKLEILEPEDGSKTNSQEIKVAGTTDKETYIRINNLPVVVDAQGFFQTLVKLKEGENKIEVSAQDIAENLETKILTVTYEKE